MDSTPASISAPKAPAALPAKPTVSKVLLLRSMTANLAQPGSVRPENERSNTFKTLFFSSPLASFWAPSRPSWHCSSFSDFSATLPSLANAEAKLAAPRAPTGFLAKLSDLTVRASFRARTNLPTSPGPSRQSARLKELTEESNSSASAILTTSCRDMGKPSRSSVSKAESSSKEEILAWRTSLGGLARPRSVAGATATRAIARRPYSAAVEES
mmetsp:Transcript_89079/g.288065  ORF Transcript_89079/g.288065 Transcript_89079/m.288065 type:complete len:214 (-) Transcript_89079:13-654(-)